MENKEIAKSAISVFPFSQIKIKPKNGKEKSKSNPEIFKFDNHALNRSPAIPADIAINKNRILMRICLNKSSAKPIKNTGVAATSNLKVNENEKN